MWQRAPTRRRRPRGGARCACATPRACVLVHRALAFPTSSVSSCGDWSLSLTSGNAQVPV